MMRISTAAGSSSKETPAPPRSPKAKDNKVSFTDDADLYGGGFLVEGTRASGTFQKCKIKSTKQAGTTLHLVAACSDGIMVQDAQLTVKVVGADKITVIFEGVESEENPYERCRP